MENKNQIELLTMEYKKLVKERGGKDVTCLSDKEIVKIRLQDTKA